MSNSYSLYSKALRKCHDNIKSNNSTLLCHTKETLKDSRDNTDVEREVLLLDRSDDRHIGEDPTGTPDPRLRC